MTFLKKYAIPFYVGCTVISSAFADSSKGTTADQISQKNLRGKMQPISASDSVEKGFTLDASFLYWNAKIDEYEFGQRTQVKGISDGAPTLITAKTKVLTPNFNSWDPGFQVGIGYIFSAREQWQSRLSWTRFNTDTKKTVSVSAGGMLSNYIVQNIAPFLLGSFGDRASSKWSLDYDTLDLELNRPFFVGKWLSLRPRVGVRGAWIDQTNKVNYHGAFPIAGGDVFFGNTSVKTTHDFKGVGIRMGSDAQFYLTRGFSILGNLSASLLWGEVDVRQYLSGFIVVDADIQIPENVTSKYKTNVIRTNIETQLGLNWQTYYHRDKFRFGISALYSFGYWFKQNTTQNQMIVPIGTDVPNIYIDTQSGDLQVQGVNIKFDFDF